MSPELQIEIAQAIVDQGLASKVYHSVEMVRDGSSGKMAPSFPNNQGDYEYVDPDDTSSLYAYIRQFNDTSAVPLKVDSCQRSYQLGIPLRVVFFNAVEKRHHGALTEKLAAFTHLKGLTLLRVIEDKFKLIRDESPQFKETFDPATFYVAFDVVLNSLLLPSTCEQDDCRTFPNPICKRP